MHEVLKEGLLALGAFLDKVLEERKEEPWVLFDKDKFLLGLRERLGLDVSVLLNSLDEDPDFGLESLSSGAF